MAQPVWITPAGSLGTIPEGKFFQLDLLADTATIATANVTSSSSTTNYFTCSSTAGLWAGLNVTFTGTIFGGVTGYNRYFVFEIIDSTHFSIASFENSKSPIILQNGSGLMTATFAQHVYFYVQAGTLPPGIQCSDNGLLEGVPKAVASLQGVPEQVSRDVTSKFTVRGYTQVPVNNVLVLDRIAERTFSLTVTGQDAPEWVTPAGQIGEYFDGDAEAGIQLEYTDEDPEDTVVIKIAAGSLPPGLTLSRTGLISGFISPLGEDITSENFEFVAEVTDGKSSSLRTFSIFVWSRNALTADNTEITADNTFITADGTPIRVPILLNPIGSIGTVRNDNFFAYKFNGLDLDGDQFQYELGFDPGDSTDLPGLTLDPNSGWLYGYIPNLGITENTYSFFVRVYKKDNPLVISDPYYYSLSVVGPVDTDITWLVNSNLGTIVNGATSILYVAAVNSAGIPLQYSILSGSDSSLPQGLSLLPSGEISGRCSFNTFALDNGTTTFDVTFNDLGVAGVNTETTFDMVHTFTVNATSVNGLINVNKTFSITVDRVYNAPYQNLYIQAMPTESDRNLINELLQNADIFQPELLYRSADPNFGKATNVVYQHAFGLTASTVDEYYDSLYKNHYWKNLTLGEIKVAQATDTAGNVLYEVIYSRVIDNLLNDNGTSVSKSVELPYPVLNVDSTETTTVYPNSLIDMRDQVIDTVGQVGTILPRWMTSKQSDGRVLGFTPAWVIAYTKPGKGNQILYYINELYGTQLNKIDFKVDRYELDNLLAKNWDPIYDSTGGSWVPSPPAYTSFDISYHYQLPVPNDSSLAFNGGTGYAVGNQIRILGSQIGGTVGVNDVIITVNTVDNNGTIVGAFCQGTAPVGISEYYYNVPGTNITGSGTGATWDLQVVPGEITTFDQNSMQFVAPVDMYTNTQAYDKYLVFPHRTILG